jgi:hypothetical protein
MEKQDIIEEIKRIAKANDGKSPGRELFEKETGVTGWYPKLWLRWNDALIEAGLPPNQLQKETDKEVLIKAYIQLTRELGHFPIEGELRRKKTSENSFPSHSVFSRLGGKEQRIEVIAEYCQDHPGHEDILDIYASRPAKHMPDQEYCSQNDRVNIGVVYLMRSGRHYKIGRTNSIGSRERQLAIKIPIPPITIHTIKTDDPVGVENYWHNRFADKRGEGEWFNLTSDDIKAFKRWKRIV